MGLRHGGAAGVVTQDAGLHVGGGFGPDSGTAAVGDPCPDPVVVVAAVERLRGVVGLWVGFDNDVVSLADAYQDRSVEVRVDRHEIGTDNGEQMVVDGEDEGGSDGGVDESQQVSLWTRLCSVKDQSVRLWDLARVFLQWIAELGHVTGAVQQDATDATFPSAFGGGIKYATMSCIKG